MEKELKTIGQIFVLMIFYVMTAQAVTISGNVIDDATKEPLPHANVVVENTDRGAASNSEGFFVIKNLSAGRYFLKIHYMGYETWEKEIVATPENIKVNANLRPSYFQLDQVVVTATRTKRILENVPVVTEIISAEEIQERGAENLAQVLEDRPGITIETDVAGGKTFKMGGIDERFILILVDGTPIAGKFNNRTELNLIDADKIDHVEIVKGPNSSLYGSEAMGGVINIITKSSDELIEINANGKTGSHDLLSGSVNMSGRHEKFGYGASFDHSQGGIDKNEPSLAIKDTRSTKGEIKLDYLDGFLGDIKFGVDALNDIRDGEDPIFDTQTTVNRLNSHLNWKKKLTSQWNLETRTYISDYHREYAETVRHSGYLARVDSSSERMIGFKSDLNYQVCTATQLDVGFDFSNDVFESERVKGDEAVRNQYGIFAQYEMNPLKKWNVIIGARYDKMTDIDGYFSPRISTMYAYTPMLKFRAAYGSGFKAPSFMDMYIDYYNVAVGYKVVGNPDLKPERSFGGNAGVEYFWNGKVLLNSTYYRNKFNDMILDEIVGPGTFSYKNIENATFTSFENQLKIYFTNHFTSSLGYNFTHIGQKSDTDNVLNVTPHIFSVRINYGLFNNKLKFSVRAQHFGEHDVRFFERYIDNTIDVVRKKPSYQLYNLTTTLKINKLFTIRAGATNLTDYTDAEMGPWIGRRIFTSIDVNY